MAEIISTEQTPDGDVFRFVYKTDTGELHYYTIYLTHRELTKIVFPDGRVVDYEKRSSMIALFVWFIFLILVIALA